MHTSQGFSYRRPTRGVGKRFSGAKEDNSNDVTKNVTENLKNVLREISDGDGDCTTKSHGRDQTHVNPAHYDDGPASRDCLPTDASALTDADAAHGSTRNGRKQLRGTAAFSEQLAR